MPVRNFTLLALSLVFGVACDKETPLASTPTPTAPTPNRAPEIVVGSVTPALGIDAVTTFRVPVEVRDPDSDAVTLSVTGCAVGVDSPVELRNGLVDLAFKTDRRCGTSIKFKATDARTASVEQSVAVQHISLTGWFRLVIGEGLYSQPTFYTTLTQTGEVITGTIFEQSDHRHSGTVDQAEPGRIDEAGRFRLRFKIPAGNDFTVVGQMISAESSLVSAVLLASGQVIEGRFAGSRWQLWQDAQY